MSDLPIEILREIFLYFTESLTDLSRICFCSRQFSSIAGPLLYKDFYLSLYFLEPQEISASIAALDGLRSERGWGGYVETFTVSGMNCFGDWDPSDSPGTMQEISPRIVMALYNMPRLRMFNWRIPSRFPVPEIIGALTVLTMVRSLKDVNLGFVRDNDEPVYKCPLGGEPGKGLVNLAIGCKRPVSDTVEALQLMISRSPNIKVLRLTGEICVDLFPDAKTPGCIPADSFTQLGCLQPSVVEISDPYEYSSPDAFTSGLIDLRSCTKLILNCGRITEGWLPRLNIAEIRKTQPEFLSRLKVLRFADCINLMLEQELHRFLGKLRGLEELSFAGQNVGFVREAGVWDLSCLETHANTFRKLLICSRVDQESLRLISRKYVNLEDFGFEFLLPPGDGVQRTVGHLADLQKLRVLRIITGARYGVIQTQFMNEIQRQSTRDLKWPALRFFCVLDRGGDIEDEGDQMVFMTVWERKRRADGSVWWAEPVNVEGRWLVTEGYSADGGLTRHDDWDEWLRRKLAGTSA